MRRAVCVSAAVIAVGFLITGGLPAEAGSAAPAPTLSITETIQGEPAPVVTAFAHWQVTQPGRAASLQVTGVNPARTTVSAVWTSRVWRPHTGIAVDATWSLAEDGLAVGSTGGSWRIQTRMRFVSDQHWPAWSGPSQPYRAAVPHVVIYSAGGRFWTEFPVRPKEAVQFQFRVRYIATAIGAHTASFAVTAAR